MIDIQGSCILPSNAPLSSNDVQDFDFAYSNRILRERSANGPRDLYDYQPAPSYERPRSSLQAKATLTKYSSRIPSTCIEDPLGRTPAQVEGEFRELWHYIQTADETDMFREYRKRQQNAKDDKWPENIEYLFFKALVKWPPVGRQKYVVDGQLKGRNEIICMSLREWSGEVRHRKQVSSHIQNIRPMFRDCPRVLRLIPKGDKDKPKKSKPHPPRPRDRGFRPIKFDIKLYPGRDEKGELKKPSHMYTTLKRKPPRDLELPLEHQTLSDYSTQYPQLVSLYASGQLDPTVPILLFDASLEITPEALLTPFELGIEFDLFSASPLDRFDRFESSVEFHRHDLASQTHHPIARKRREFVSDLAADPHTLHTIPFGSDIWAKKISHLSRQLRDAALLARSDATRDDGPRPYTHPAADDHVARARDAVRRSLAGLGVVQQISGRPRAAAPDRAPPSSQRLLYAFWRFRLAEPGAAAETVFRRVVLSTRALSARRDERLRPSVSSGTPTPTPAPTSTPTPTPTLGSEAGGPYVKVEEAFLAAGEAAATWNGFGFGGAMGAVEFAAAAPYMASDSFDIGELGAFDMGLNEAMPGAVQAQTRPPELHHPRPCHGAAVPTVQTLDHDDPAAWMDHGDITQATGSDHEPQAVAGSESMCYSTLPLAVGPVDQMPPFHEQQLEGLNQQQWGDFEGFYDADLGHFNEHGYVPPAGHGQAQGEDSVELPFVPSQQEVCEMGHQESFQQPKESRNPYSDSNCDQYGASVPYNQCVENARTPSQQSEARHRVLRVQRVDDIPVDLQTYPNPPGQGEHEPMETPHYHKPPGEFQPYQSQSPSHDGSYSQATPDPKPGFDNPDPRSGPGEDYVSQRPHQDRHCPSTRDVECSEESSDAAIGSGQAEAGHGRPPQGTREALGSPFTTPSTNRVWHLKEELDS